MELDAPTRSRRKRALQIVLTLDAVAELHDSIAALLNDDDQFLRIEAIRVLATVDSPSTRQVLRDAMVDPHPLVQEAAESALTQLTSRDTVPAAVIARETVRLNAESAAAQPPPQAQSPANPSVPTPLSSLSPIST